MAGSMNADSRWTMGWWLLSATVILVQALPVLAHAAAHTKVANSDQPNPCDREVSQFEMNMCSSEQYRKSDARLKAIYTKALHIMEEDLADARRDTDADLVKYQRTAIQKLKAAEQAWIQYRDLHCDAAGQQYEGGSMQPMVVSDCLKQATDHRIEEIKQAYENDRTLE